MAEEDLLAATHQDEFSGRRLLARFHDEQVAAFDAEGRQGIAVAEHQLVNLEEVRRDEGLAGVLADGRSLRDLVEDDGRGLSHK